MSVKDFEIVQSRLDGVLIDYKDTVLLQKYVSTQGKIFDAKRTSTKSQHQRQLTNAIKRARFLALMKYSG